MPPETPVVAAWLKPGVMVCLLATLWTWESLQPFLPQFGESRARRTHAGRNLAITVGNTLVLALLFSGATVWVGQAAQQRAWGLLRWLVWPPAAEWALALLLLDGWLYLWHRANHRLPWLWRFHRMHHSDPQMDVTTATRFHLGEHVQSSLLRLGIVPLFGVSIEQVAVYDVLVIANTLIHHANISFGPLDRWLRGLFVTPDMHKVHHSRWPTETDSNYSTVFSFWDRLGRSFRMRADCATIQFGLAEFDDPAWQTCRGMLRTPLRAAPTGPAREPVSE